MVAPVAERSERRFDRVTHKTMLAAFLVRKGDHGARVTSARADAVHVAQEEARPHHAGCGYPEGSSA